MQFLVIGRDGTDSEAPQRRQAVRAAHIALGDELVASGNMKYGVAILDDDGRMVGSMLVVEFSTRGDLDAWLAKEPYVVGKVWEEVEVAPCRVGPSFESMRLTD